ncbi:hypothetical protein UlMin_031879 [Ulmus minor]
MSTQSTRPPIRGYRRRKQVMELDLNRAPPGDNRDQEGTSTQVSTQPAQTSQQGISVPPAAIDVDAIDDDVIESSPRAFAEAKNKSRRIRGRAIVDVESEEQTRPTHNNNKRRRPTTNNTIINCDYYINLESNSNSMRESVPPPPPPPPPKEPTFNCPICLGPLAEEVSTKCGHIFCKKCIKTAIDKSGKCPTCRKKVTHRELIRVFLPATS